MIKIWTDFISNKPKFYEFVLSILASVIFGYFFKKYLSLVESWDHNLGVFDDPLFLKDPIDFSIPIFVLTYGTILFFILYHLNNPTKLMHLIQLAVLVDIFRVISLFFIRLDAPEMIELYDPVLNFLIYEINPETNSYNQHDLFFSGHTANLFVISCLFKKKSIRNLFLVITLITGLLLVLQKVHYSIDVIFAPVISLFILYIHKKIFLNS